MYLDQIVGAAAEWTPILVGDPMIPITCTVEAEEYKTDLALGDSLVPPVKACHLIHLKIQVL